MTTVKIPYRFKKELAKKCARHSERCQDSVRVMRWGGDYDLEGVIIWTMLLGGKSLIESYGVGFVAGVWEIPCLATLCHR